MQQGEQKPRGETVQTDTQRIRTAALHAGLMDPAHGRKPVPLGTGYVTGILDDGGTARVFEIYNERLGVHRAVKVLKPNHTPSARERFEAEMRITAQLHHPNIVQIHTVGDWKGLPYIEMERISGDSLDRLIKHRGKLPLPVALAAGIIICRALAFMHKVRYDAGGRQCRGILHRDLKPANVMIANDGTVKLMDFGTALPAASRTEERLLVGSLQYLSPEQMKNDPVDGRADIYSLGCVLYEMLSGKRVFPQRSVGDLMVARGSNRYAPLDETSPATPRVLRRLIDRCLSPRPELRHQNASDVLRELETIFRQRYKGSPEEAVVSYISLDDTARFTIPRRYRELVLAGIGLAALALAGGITTLLLLRLDQPAAPPPVSEEPKTDTVVVYAPPTEPRIERPRRAPAAPKRRPPAQPRTARPEKTLRDELAAEHGTEDIGHILMYELRDKRYDRVLRLLDRLEPGELSPRRAALYRLRALTGTGQSEQRRALLSGNDIDDIEFCLEKARMQAGENRHADALALLERCQGMSAELGNLDRLRAEVLYRRAQSLTALYDRSADEADKERALESWFNVKHAFRQRQDHPAYDEAARQIVRLSM